MGPHTRLSHHLSGRCDFFMFYQMMFDSFLVFEQFVEQRCQYLLVLASKVWGFAAFPCFISLKLNDILWIEYIWVLVWEKNSNGRHHFRFWKCLYCFVNLHFSYGRLLQLPLAPFPVLTPFVIICDMPSRTCGLQLGSIPPTSCLRIENTDWSGTLSHPPILKKQSGSHVWCQIVTRD